MQNSDPSEDEIQKLLQSSVKDLQGISITKIIDMCKTHYVICLILYFNNFYMYFCILAWQE